MIQGVIIAIVFVLAIGYLGYSIWKQFSTKKGCPGGCGCSGIDIEKIEKELANKINTETK